MGKSCTKVAQAEGKGIFAKRKTLKNSMFSRVLTGTPSGARTLDTLIKSEVLGYNPLRNSPMITRFFDFLSSLCKSKKVAQKLQLSPELLFLKHPIDLPLRFLHSCIRKMCVNVQRYGDRSMAHKLHSLVWV